MTTNNSAPTVDTAREQDALAAKLVEMAHHGAGITKRDCETLDYAAAALRTLRRERDEARTACEAVLNWYEVDSSEFNREMAIAACRRALSCSPGELAPASKVVPGSADALLAEDLVTMAQATADAGMNVTTIKLSHAFTAEALNAAAARLRTLSGYGPAAGEPAPEPQPREDEDVWLECAQCQGRQPDDARRSYCCDAMTIRVRGGPVPVAEPQTVEPPEGVTLVPALRFACGCVVSAERHIKACGNPGHFRNAFPFTLDGYDVENARPAQPSTSQSAEMTFLIGTVDASGLVPSTSEAPAAVTAHCANCTDADSYFCNGTPRVPAALLPGVECGCACHRTGGAAPVVEGGEPQAFVRAWIAELRTAVGMQGAFPQREAVLRQRIAWLASSPQPDAPPCKCGHAKDAHDPARFCRHIGCPCAAYNAVQPDAPVQEERRPVAMSDDQGLTVLCDDGSVWLRQVVAQSPFPECEKIYGWRQIEPIPGTRASRTPTQEPS